MVSVKTKRERERLCDDEKRIAQKELDDDLLLVLGLFFVFCVIITTSLFLHDYRETKTKRVETLKITVF